ncbi:hypothetical protein SDJN03_29198, partial [Cucurbita argyrosperma subsp. sororia]
MGKKRNNEKQKVILPPELPPEVTQEEIKVSDEDLQFVKENQDYAVSVIRLYTKSIAKFYAPEDGGNEEAMEEGGVDNGIVKKLCSGAIKYLFINEGQHGGEATMEAVRLIADQVKFHDCQLPPDSIQPFLHLTFDEDLRKEEKQDEHNKVKNKKHRKTKNHEESSHLQGNDGRQSTRTKFTEEVASNYRAASLASDVMKQREMQSDTLSAVFETYFRISRHTMQSLNARKA